MSEKALLLAKKENKPMMIFLVKKNCFDCKEMLNTIFTNQSYIEKLNKKYISVIITYESQIDYPIELFYSTQFPTLFFISSKDESFLYEPIYGNISPYLFNKIYLNIYL
jgi:hypothetical protein